MKKRFKRSRRFNIRFLFWVYLFVVTLYFNVISLDNFSYGEFINGESFIDINIDKNRLLHNLSFNIDDFIEEEKVVSVFKDIEVEIERPKVYLYSTHQTEEYKDSDVYQISLDFKNILNNKRIDVDVEDTKVMDVVKSKGLKYKDSYKVTRALIEDRLDEYDLYIDIHRDSSKWSGSTTTIDGVNYARVMFVIGKGHEKYQFNYDLCSALNKLLKNYDSSLSRGIYVREGSSYNQDLNKNVILMELGGVENTSEEVNNTLNILADVFEYYLYE